MSGLPDIPKDTPTGLRRFLSKLKETFEVRNAVIGSPLDSNPTFRDLIDAGLIKVDPNVPLTANGRQFTLDTKTWMSANLPDWITDNTNPPAPTGLTVTSNTANLVLTWDAATYANYKQTLVYRNTVNNLTTAELIGSTTGNTYVDNLPPAGTVYYYWIRDQSKSELVSDFNDVNGTSTANQPGAPTVESVFDEDQLVISWTTPTSNLAIQYYIVSWGAFAGGNIAGVSQSNSFRFIANFGGQTTRTYWVQAVDINGTLGLAASVVITITLPSGPIVDADVEGGTLVLSYSSTKGSLPIAYYELRWGTSWDSYSAIIATTPGTRTDITVNWQGNRTFWIKAYDTAGNTSSAGSYVWIPTLPTMDTLVPQIIDNNVLLTWTSTQGSLPIDYYKLYKDAQLVSTTAAQFAVLFESIAGTYTYAIAPVDTAGNVGNQTSVQAAVAQPPDFTLFANTQSTLTGTHTNTFKDTGIPALIAATDITETWQTHFTNRGWNTPQDQINAGYSYFIVGKTTGQYKETVDYGAQIGSAKITLVPTVYFSNGTVGVVPTIETSPNNSDWTSYPSTYSVYGVSFRYVRYTLDFSAAHTGSGLATDTANFLAYSPLSYVLDLKLKTYQGMTACNAGDAGGTTVDITGRFIDVQAITVTPAGTSAMYAIYDFVDAPNPTQFKILLFNTAGTRVSGTASWVVRGV